MNCAETQGCNGQGRERLSPETGFIHQRLLALWRAYQSQGDRTLPEELPGEP